MRKALHDRLSVLKYTSAFTLVVQIKALYVIYQNVQQNQANQKVNLETKCRSNIALVFSYGAREGRYPTNFEF